MAGLFRRKAATCTGEVLKTELSDPDVPNAVATFVLETKISGVPPGLRPHGDPDSLNAHHQRFVSSRLPHPCSLRRTDEQLHGPGFLARTPPSQNQSELHIIKQLAFPRTCSSAELP
eukprot:370573-Rhodomonas_salina.1